jgi:hypothetical protein
MAGRPKGLPKTGGKKPGSKNFATKEAKIAIEDLAKTYAPAALAALNRVATSSESDAAVVAASIGLLDRGYGKPRQAMEISGDLKLRTMSDADLDAAIARLLAKS